MYKEVRESSRRLTRLMTRQVRERQVGKQMALILLTNFLCWFPIIIMGLMAIGGYALPATIYSWTAVFVLPLNSATNPLIYTFSHFKGSFFTSNRSDSLTNRVLKSSKTHKNDGSTRAMIPKPIKVNFEFVN